MPVLSATPLSCTPLSCTPIAARAVGASAQSWAEQMLADYKTRYASTGAWLDANPDIEAEFLARLQPGEYLHTTFGPDGQDKTECDFALLMQATDNLTAKTVTKSGDTLRWDIDGTVSTQDNLPAHTLTGDGVVTVSSTDGWSGVTVVAIEGAPLDFDVSQFSQMTNLTELRIGGTGAFGLLSAVSALTDLTRLYIYQTDIASSDLSALSGLVDLEQLLAYECSNLTGDLGVVSDGLHTSLQEITAYISPGITVDVADLADLPLDSLYLHVTSAYGDAAALADIDTMRHLFFDNTTVTWSGGTIDWPDIQRLSFFSLGWDQTTVDQFVNDLYALWVSGMTYATPTVNIGGSNAAPSGTYQAANPPTTPLEKIYTMVNDNTSTGNNTFSSFTYTSP